MKFDILGDAQIVRSSDESKRAWIRSEECEQVVPLSFLSQSLRDEDQPAEQSPSSLRESLEMLEFVNFLQLKDSEAYIT